MNGKTILESISGIKMDYVEQAAYHKQTDLIVDELENAEKNIKPKHNFKWKFTAAAACLIMVICAYIGISEMNKTPNDKIDDMQVAKNENTTAAINDNNKTTTSESVEDLSPVKYSEINLCPAGEFNHDNVLSGADVMSVVAFDESMLNRCGENGSIIEGTVTNIYTKEYDFDVYSDKFEENGVLHNREFTIVYEIKVNKVWYGDYKEDTILIEDYSYFLDPVWEIKTGRTYVIPVVYEGDKIYSAYVDDFKEGDCERDSIYSSLYPYNEPIEVTMDGNYLVSSEWSTLIKKNARKVIMDVDGYESFHDIYMVNGQSFKQQMENLIDKTIK